jgi:hypothetical protein
MKPFVFFLFLLLSLNASAQQQQVINRTYTQTEVDLKLQLLQKEVGVLLQTITLYEILPKRTNLQHHAPP